MYIQFSPMHSNELKIVYEYSSDDNFIGDLVISADREISTSELDLISQKIKEKANNSKKRKEKEQQEKLSQELFGQYYSERIIMDADSTLNKINLYEDAKNWYLNNANIECPTSRELADNLDKMYRKNVRGKWKGIAINFGNDNEHDDLFIEGEVIEQQPSPRTRYLQRREYNSVQN